MNERLPRPTKIESDMWVDEGIWGHRLYDEQTPWLCVMEFLNIVYAESSEGRALKETVPNTLAYTLKSRLYLRNILFNNPQMAVIGKQYKNDNTSQWKKWIEVMTDNSAGISNPDFSYLQRRFSSFEHFTSVVEFVRSSTIEGENNKRWSSQFVFPYGPSCLYVDLNVKEKGITNDRRFFARTGEIMYLMLCRSGRGEEILDHLLLKVLDENNKFNRIISMLQPPTDELIEGTSIRTSAYLPYLNLQEYRALADDWLNIFNCKLSNFDFIPYLVNLSGLHMIIYYLKRSMDILGINKKPTFLLEIVSPKKNVIRELSSNSFNENNSLSRRAVEQYIRKITDTQEWMDAAQSNDSSETKSILKRVFSWPRDNKDHEIDNLNSPEEILDRLIDNAINRHLQHVNKFHNVWGREIGLSSKRGSRRVRYAPHDSLLKSLVLSVVPERMEFQDFLSELYDKYGIIIGDRQAEDYILSGQADQVDFDENAKRLEQRLASMGLLKRLSDACAYVENPFATRGE
ncbi:hypothetical protein C0R09_21550 [Brevibacillus laterosporus]|uniref:hypothetical protein n=1 Tax=Brevibacillus laterosporus TaxID=1465 RepID=UPI000C76920D|nr:hypothetical protein [Brevibacillus laterosporus]AUM66901.1 hypothetical protein C0R09_21550 [Brevibacillus laterosporus]